MKDFSELKVAVHRQFEEMSKSDLFVTDVGKDELWETYINSFPEGTNPIFKERTEHDCQCCKQFIRACGSVVAIVDNKLVSIWDIEIGGFYQAVSDALSSLVKSKPVRDVFIHYQQHLGTDFNHQMTESGTIKWNHFHYILPKRVVKKKDDIGTYLSKIRSRKEVFKRGLEEITDDAVDTVVELIEQNSIYRGQENKAAVDLFSLHKQAFDLITDNEERDAYSWTVSMVIGSVAAIRNTAIGTLLTDLSEGMDINDAVRLFESKVAPTNYKRPTALITKKMIDNAQKKVAELGIEDSLHRRFAVLDDISIDNIIFADRSSRKAMNVFDELAKEVPVDIKKLDKIEEVSIDDFINTIIPKADNIEVYFDNNHVNNLVSLIAPQNVDAKRIFKWDNNFSWAYNGEVADSLKERVKRAGGNVSGVLRFSIQWNDGDNNQNDFDAHCMEPNTNVIFFENKGRRHPSSGMLDVDIINPGSAVAVENITWDNRSRMQEGTYTFLVHNYSHNGGMTGFAAEIEYEGKIYQYNYGKGLRQGEKVVVAEITFSREGGIKFIKSLPSSETAKIVWSVSTRQFHNTTLIMNSPNHWNGKSTGNKHWFFILKDCKNTDKARGFFNEFLKEDLTEHRKVFEVLGGKTKAPKSTNQLSGLGFSSTQRNSVLCKVVGSFNRIIKIKF